MGMYDLCIRTDDLRETAGIARKIGWNGLGYVIPYSVNYMREMKDAKNVVKSIRDIDIGVGIEIRTKNQNDVRKTAKNVRKEVELITVRGDSPEVSRAALETPEVDILIHQGDMRINHVLAKLSAKNNVAIGFIFSELLLSYKKTRISLFSTMINNARVLRKYRSPFVVSSGSLSEWDLRSPSDLLAFGRLLGYQENQVTMSMSDRILKENRKRLGKKWVMPGVEIE